MYLSLFYLFLLGDKHYRVFLVVELTHASGNFAEKHCLTLVKPFSNQPKLLETLFIGHELCSLLFPITLFKFWWVCRRQKFEFLGLKVTQPP